MVPPKYLYQKTLSLSNTPIDNRLNRLLNMAMETVEMSMMSTQSMVKK